MKLYVIGTSTNDDLIHQNYYGFKSLTPRVRTIVSRRRRCRCRRPRHQIRHIRELITAEKLREFRYYGKASMLSPLLLDFPYSLHSILMSRIPLGSIKNETFPIDSLARKSSIFYFLDIIAVVEEYTIVVCSFSIESYIF